MTISKVVNRELTASELDTVSGGGFAGIDALIAVTQMKVERQQ
jgi:hypothetical protein